MSNILLTWVSSNIKNYASKEINMFGDVVG